jgi:hypothetical protein
VTPPILLALVAVCALWAGGYLFGTRRGREARAALRAQALAQAELCQTAQARAQELEQQVAVQAGLRSELQAALAPLAEQEAEVRRLAESLQRVAGAVAASGEAQKALKSTLDGVVQPLMARSSDAQKQRAELEQLLSEKLEGRAVDERLRRVVAEVIRPIQERTQTDQLRALMTEALKPVLEHERLGADLARLRLGESRKDLNELLTAVAQFGALSTVLISDERGLLLAANDGARDAEVRAGLSSLVLTLANSYVQSDVAVPLAVLVHDAANQSVLHRIFVVDGHRFLLTAVSKGRFVPPNLLDPALDRIEQLMADWTVTQERPAIS